MANTKKIIIVNPFNTFFSSVGVLCRSKNEHENFVLVKLNEAAMPMYFERSSVRELDSFLT